MKGMGQLLLLLAGVVGCATSNGVSDSPPEQISWPVGQYLLEGRVAYRTDTQRSTLSESVDYRGELVIRPDGDMRLDSSSGLCEPRLPEQVRVDQRQRQRTFSCMGVSYVLKPAGESVRGEIRLRVTESIRRRGQCKRTDYVDGKEVCVAYFFTVDRRQATKRGRLRVTRISISGRP